MVGVMGGSRVPMELCDNPGGKREKKKDKVECFDFTTAHFRSNEDRRDLELGRHKTETKRQWKRAKSLQGSPWFRVKQGQTEALTREEDQTRLKRWRNKWRATSTLRNISPVTLFQFSIKIFN